MPTLREQLLPAMHLRDIPARQQIGVGEVSDRPRTLRDILSSLGPQAQTAGSFTGLDESAESLGNIIGGRVGLTDLPMLRGGTPAIRGPLRGILRARNAIVPTAGALKPARGDYAKGSELGDIPTAKSVTLQHEGDTDGKVDTDGKRLGKFGMQVERKQAIEKREGRKLSDQEAFDIYYDDIYQAWAKKDGFVQAPDGVQRALLDMGFNLGPGFVREVPKAAAALKRGDIAEVLRQTLDTASGLVKQHLVNTKTGKTSTRLVRQLIVGIAKRRADNYNTAIIEMGHGQSAELPYVTSIRVKKDRLQFLTSAGNVIIEQLGTHNEIPRDIAVPLP